METATGNKQFLTIISTSAWPHHHKKNPPVLFTPEDFSLKMQSRQYVQSGRARTLRNTSEMSLASYGFFTVAQKPYFL
jgi:hypothetical protein